MINMFGILQLLKDLPDPVSYSVFGPIVFPIPKNFSNNQTTNFHEISILGLTIDNCSSKVQQNIRILYSGNFEYEPKIEFKQRDIEVEYSIDRNKKEIIIEEIPPSECIYISFFNVDEDFKINNIVIKNKAITKPMQILAEAKNILKYKFFWNVFILIIIAVVISMFSFYTIWSTQKEQEYIVAALSPFGTCNAYIFYNKPKEEKLFELEKRFNSLDYSLQDFILTINRVSTFSELKNKEKIILCEPLTTRFSGPAIPPAAEFGR